MIRTRGNRSHGPLWRQNVGMHNRERRASLVIPRLAGAYAGMVARHAAANGVPASLVHRVIMRESRYNPRAVSKGNYGMMQIRLGTARAMGYTGTASGLLDPEVNMTYAVKYLAGAYRVAGGSEGGAVANYARGYYHQAKRQNLSPYGAPASAAFAMQTSPRDVRAPVGILRRRRTNTRCFKLGRKSRRRLPSPPASRHMAALPRAARNSRHCMVPVAAFEAALGQAMWLTTPTLVPDLKPMSALGH